MRKIQLSNLLIPLVLATGALFQGNALSAEENPEPTIGLILSPIKDPYGSYGTFEKLKKAAEQGSADAQNKLATCYGRGIGISHNYQQAFEWAMKSAKQGNAEGQMIVAGCYLQGKGVIQDQKEAFKWMKLSADQGNADAQSGLGVMYGQGIGVTKNPAETIKWYTLAANQGASRGSVQSGCRICVGNRY